MPHKIKGTIYYTDPQTLLDLFSPIIKGINGRPRLTGYDIEYTDPGIEFYLNSFDDQNFYLDATFSIAKSEFDKIKTAVKERLLEFDLLFLVTFFEEDESEENNEDGESFNHPDFKKRYLPPKSMLYQKKDNETKNKQ